MNTWDIILAGLGGIVLGTFYFTSLWITVQQLPTTLWPLRLTIGSLLGRMGIVLLGFYLIIDGEWQRALIGLVGFLVARTLLIRRWQPNNKIKFDL
ncbi:N-ATPase, AtpR subunit [Lyngbya aestuarii BL J]|uniref:N-ATPase, AtpR subunit n=1 Tax=Lyngbya aestuarii BL J TaxID=1348334 RepID=U7QR30_9CYAN|nr:ATP synthase subunit I [Lyngbya aestuarii]ERT09570.1 N-ATPase, AtpR subunit [Lyngbya aestuarii BL J]